jgi:predicted small metal-binding protein
MREFRCGELVPGCAAVIEGESDDEVLARVETHARDAHGMPEVPPDVVDTIHASIVERVT